ncbi:hypothetical protein ENSA7_47580 [Enhygromyxa salina]|uniref:Chromosome partition protein Smc n=2 Tax=Enhygromyxa salina TaxID=215803 RepID=A0A2S9YJ50_9BACT|nr:hypothetical protein ENSA7_47580 [Enhygromyxa salina]
MVGAGMFLAFSVLAFAGPKICTYEIEFENVDPDIRAAARIEVAAALHGRGDKEFRYQPGPNTSEYHADIRVTPDREHAPRNYLINGLAAAPGPVLHSRIASAIIKDCRGDLKVVRTAYSRAGGDYRARERAEKEVAVLREQIQTLSAERDEARDHAKSLSAELETLKDENDETRKRLEAELEKVKDRLTIVTKQRGEALLELEALYNDYQSIVGELEQRDQRITALEDDLTGASEIGERLVAVHSVALGFDVIGTGLLAIGAINGAYCGPRWLAGDEDCQRKSWRSVEDSLHIGISGGVILGVGLTLHIAAFSAYAHDQRKQIAGSTAHIRWEGTRIRF